MSAHTHLPSLSESRIMFDPYARRFRTRNGSEGVFRGNAWWLYLSHETHVYVGHEPGPCVGEPWCALLIPLGEEVKEAAFLMRRCLELAHAFVRS